MIYFFTDWRDEIMIKAIFIDYTGTTVMPVGEE